MLGFIQSPPTLVVYDVAHSLPRGGVGRGFLFNEDDTKRHFPYRSGTFRELFIIIIIINIIIIILLLLRLVGHVDKMEEGR